MENTIELKGRQVLKIKTVSTGNKYKVDKDHKWFTSSFNNYSFNGTVFSVNQDDEFIAWKNSGKLYAVDLKTGTRTNDDGESVPTLQMVSCVNVDQEIAMAQTESTLNKIFNGDAVEAISEDLLASLTK